MPAGGPSAQESEPAAASGCGSAHVRPIGRSPGEAIRTASSGPVMGTTPQLVDGWPAEGQGELGVWLCQQGVAGRTSGGPAPVKRRICSNLNNYGSISNSRGVNGGVNRVEMSVASDWSEPVVSPWWCESVGVCA